VHTRALHQLAGAGEHHAGALSVVPHEATAPPGPAAAVVVTLDPFRVLGTLGSFGTFAPLEPGALGALATVAAFPAVGPGDGLAAFAALRRGGLVAGERLPALRPAPPPPATPPAPSSTLVRPTGQIRPIDRHQQPSS
jgi:hypothetical protein